MTKYGYLGQVTPQQLWNWLLDPNQSLPGENPKPGSSSPGRRLSKKRVEELSKQEAAIRRFRLTAKHRRAKAAVDGPNPLAGITLKGAGKKKVVGTKRIAGGSVTTAMKQFTGTEIERFWMSTRTCGHCKERGLWSKGSLGQCQACSKFTKLA